MKIKCGVQFYTLRKYAKDKEGVEKCFKFCKEVGAEVVQLSAVAELSPDVFFNLSKEHNLEICTTHKKYDKIVNNTKELCKEHQTYNCNIMGLGMIPKQKFDIGSKEDILKFCEEMNKAQKIAQEFNINLAYHNHDFEFKKIGDELIYDILIENLDKNILFILDTFWVDFAGEDVLKWIDVLNSRLGVLHLKDTKLYLNKFKWMTRLGKGRTDFAAILQRAESKGCKYALIELDFSLNPFKAVKESMEYLKKVYIDK